MNKNVFDSLGGNVKEEINQFPIDELGLYSLTNEKGKIFYPDNQENIYRILQNHPMFKGHFRYNEWVAKKQILENEVWRDVADKDYIEIQGVISTLYPWFCRVNDKNIRNAIIRACINNKMDEAVDFIRSLPEWDGAGRIDVWLYEVYGENDDFEYYEAVGSNFFKGMVARIINPGVKFDTVLILFGEQGLGKSTSMRAIAGDWYAETALQAKNKDFLMTFQGKLLVEFSEGATMSRSDSKQLKAMVSNEKDTYRLPYGSEMIDIKRRCVFAMTTNDDEFLKDETGNRRYLPIKVTKKANVQWIKDNRDQMFAEALYRYEVLKESIWEYPKTSTYHQENRMVSSGYEEKIGEWLANPVSVGGQTIALPENLTTLRIYEYIWPGGGNFHNLKYEIVKALKKNGFKSERKYVNDIRGNYWVK